MPLGVEAFFLFPQMQISKVLLLWEAPIGN